MPTDVFCIFHDYARFVCSSVILPQRFGSVSPIPDWSDLWSFLLIIGELLISGLLEKVLSQVSVSLRFVFAPESLRACQVVTTFPIVALQHGEGNSVTTHMPLMFTSAYKRINA